MLSIFGLETNKVKHVFTKVYRLLNSCTCDRLAYMNSVPDPYENCYAVVRGTKTFVLLPPIEYYCIHGKS
jgi:putative lipase involved disintegration of autophagic bodies